MANGKPGIVVSVFNEKGGSGKTTTACQLAASLGRRNFDVLLADCDPQATSSNWASRYGGKNFPATCWQGFRYGENVATELGALASKYDIIVVDCAPSVEQPSTWGALLVSSLAIIPTRLNMQDLAALSAAKRLVRQAWDTVREHAIQAGLEPPKDFPVRVLPTAVRLHIQDDEKALATLAKDKEIPLAGVTFGDRKAFPRSMVYGSSVHAVPKSDESVKEVDALTDEVLTLLGMSLNQKERLAA